MTNLEKLNDFFKNDNHSVAEDAVLYHFLSVAYAVGGDAAECAATLYFDFVDGDIFVPANKIEGGLGAALRALIGLNIHRHYTGEDPVYERTSTLIKMLNNYYKQIKRWIDSLEFCREEAIEYWKNSTVDYSNVEIHPLTEDERKDFKIYSQANIDYLNKIQIEKGHRPYLRW